MCEKIEDLRSFPHPFSKKLQFLLDLFYNVESYKVMYC